MDSFPNLIFLIAIMAVFSLAPFMAVLVSSFVKIVVVIHMVRSALGLQQVPPSLAVNGIAIILSIYVMAPVLMDAYDRFQQYGIEVSDIKNPDLKDALIDASTPLKGFLIKHASLDERKFFVHSTQKLWPERYAKKVKDDDLLILIPSFLISELTAALQIGFLLFLPFIIIDMIIANILISMGMIMVAPVTISLPFKVLLFVMVDGWTKLVHGLILSYQ